MGGKIILAFVLIFIFMSAGGAFISGDIWAGIGQLALALGIILFMRWRRRKAERMMNWAPPVLRPRDYSQAWWRRR